MTSQLCYILVRFPFWTVLKTDNYTQRGSCVFLRVSATGSCPLPRASPRTPAGRLSHCSPPACPPLGGFQPCPATWSRSPPPEPESWKQDNKASDFCTEHPVTYESQKDTSPAGLLMSLCGAYLLFFFIFHPVNTTFKKEFLVLCVI